MRQEIIYSLLAVAAVPVTVNAADVTIPTGIATDSWEGTENKSGFVQIASGTVTCKLGTLVPGRYQLKLITTASVTVTVKGKSATSSSNLTVPFELTKTEEVEFTVKVNNAATTLSNISLNLTADFDAISQALLNYYNTTMIAIGKYAYVKANPDALEVMQLGAIKNIIESIKLASGSTAYEDIWKKYELWLYPENISEIPVYKDITAIKEAADLKEIAYQAAILKKSLNEAQEALETTTKPIVPSYLKGALTEEFTKLAAEVDAYEKGTTVEGYDEIATKIKDFNTKVANAKSIGIANDASYSKIETAINTATNDYLAEYNNLKKNILKERIVDAIGTANRNATLSKEAEDEMKKQFDAIGAVKQKADALYKEGKSTEWAAKTDDADGYQDLLDEIAKKISSIRTNYTNYAKRLEAADDLYVVYTELANEAKEENAVAIQKNVKGVGAAVQAVDKALANLLAYINQHLSKSGLGKDLVSDGEITDAKGNKYVEPITKALADLKAAAKEVTDNEKAYNTMVEEVDELIAGLDEYLAGIEAYGDFDPVKVNYAAEIARIKKLGTDLKALAKAKHDDKDLLAEEYYASEEYTTKKTELTKAITTFKALDLANEVAIYKADMEALNKAQAAYDALLAKIKGLFIYTSSDKDVKYSNAWMKTYQDKIDEHKKTITDYIAITGIDKLKGMPNLASTINTITTDLTGFNDDKAIQEANTTYQKDQDTKALETTYQVAKDQWTVMDTKINAIVDDKDTYGISNDIIQDKKKAVKEKFDLITDPNNTPGLNIDALTEILNQISDLRPALKEVEDYAAAIAVRVAANKAALTTFATKVNELNTNYNNTLAAAISADAATRNLANFAWDGLFTAVRTDIDALYNTTPIIKIEDVKNTTVIAAYKREELQESDYADILKGLNDRIAAAKANADLAQKNYADYMQVYNLFNTTTITSTCITDRITTAKTRAKAEDSGEAWTNHYAKLWDDGDPETETGFEEILKNYKTELADAYKAFNFDGTDTDKFPSAIKDNLMTKARTLATNAEAVPAKVKANKAEYTQRNIAVGSAKTKYKNTALEINALDETTLTKQWKDTLLDFYNQLIEKEKLMLEDYKNGLSDDGGTLRRAINDIATEIDKIQKRIANEYDPSVQADNEKKLQSIRDAVDAAKQTFRNANTYMDQFRNLTSETFAAAIQAAATASVALNDALATFPDKIDKAEDNAQAHFDAVNATPKVYKEYEADLAVIEALQDDITDALDTYKAAIDAQVSSKVGTTITDYRTALEAAKTAVNNFTLTGAAIKKADRDVFFKTVEDLVTALEVDQATTKIADLDAKLQEAANESTGVYALIDIAKNETAASVLGKLLGEMEAKAIADNDYALTLDKETQETYFGTEEKDGQLKELKDYREDYDIQYKDKTLAANFTTLLAKYKAWKNANVVTIAQAADRTYDTLQALIAERIKLLADATAFIENYAAAGDMKKTTLAKIANDIQAVKDDVETAKGKFATLKGFINTKKMPEDAANNDNLALKQVDADIQKAKTIDLRAAEANYLKSAINDLTLAYYDLEKANAEAAAPFKEQIIGNGKTGDEEVKSLKDRLEAIADDNTKTVDDLKQFETVISDLMEQLNTAAQGDSQAIKDDLTKKLNAVSAKATLSSYDQAVQTALDSELQALKQKIAAEADVIAKSTSPVFDKENIEAAIAQLETEVNALLSKAADAQKKIDNNNAAAEKLTADLTKLEEALAELETTLNDTEQFQKVSSTTFRAKLNQLANEIANKKTEVAEAAANMKAEDADLADRIADFVTDTDAAILDVKNSAARREIVAYADAFTAEVAAITYKPGNYTDGDLNDIEKSLDKIKAAIGAPQSVDEEGNDVAAKGLYLTANGSKITPVTASITYAGLAAAKTTVEGIAKAIEEVKAKIANNTLVPEPTVIPGDITGTGEVTGDDFDKFANDLVNGNVPQKGDANFASYDANGDNLITVADLQAILNLMVGNNADGTPKTAARIKQAAEEVSGTLSVKATQMGNVTRLAISLDSTADFTGFQMDVFTATDTRVVGESLGETMPDMLLLSSNLETSAHRIVGFSSSGTTFSSGTILYIDIEGAGDVKFADVVFTTATAKSVAMNLGEATGISGLESEQNNNIFYDLGGKVMRTLKKGINIIRNAGGTTKKVVVK